MKRKKIYKIKDWKNDKTFFVHEYEKYYFLIRGHRYSIYGNWIYKD